MVRCLVDKYSLQVDITLVQSEQNLADKLTRVPKRWIDIMKQGSNPDQIHVIHRKSGHPRIRRPTYFV